jgi:catechol 2,3-dioxygenase-like lactoylglutathione lyase family enzyme
MSGDIDVIHHPGLVAENIDAAVAQYERLGFAFTPLSIAKITIKPDEEPVYFGVGNRNAIFEKNFLEIVGVTDRERWNQITKAQRGPFDLDERLNLYQGLHILHFGADDLEVVRARFKQQGLASSDIATLTRNVQTTEGERIMRAKTLHFPKGANPEALMQIAQHVTPELALQPRYIQHRNGARLLTEVIVCTNAPEELAAKYGRYSGHAVDRRDAGQVVNLGHSRVLVVDPEQLRKIVPGYAPPVLPFVAGLTVATTSLETARSVLQSERIEFTEGGGRLVIGPEHACGSAVLFETLGATR